MNMNQSPTADQLRVLIARCNDRAAHHMVWVGRDGEVHVDPLPEDLSPVGFEAKQAGKMKFRFETYMAGNSFVGKKAAAESTHVNDLFADLVKHWKAGHTGALIDEMD